MTSAQNKTLRGWKEIATHVGRDVRTVQRWERQRGLPVKRLQGAERGNVFALSADLDNWLHPAKELRAVESVSPAIHSIPATVPSLALQVELPERRPPARRWVWYFAAISGSLAVFVLSLVYVHTRRVRPNALVPEAGTPEKYVSPVADVDALYLRGMYLFGQRTPDSLLQAKQVMTRATALDPKDAPAWSGLAQILVVVVSYGTERVAEDRTGARTAAERALELQPGLAEPHAVLGFVDFFWSGEIREAEPEFLRALRINPACALAHNWYGTLLTYEARFPEALEQLDEAQRLDPSSTAILANRALALGLSGHREEAVQLLTQAQSENPIASVHFTLGVLSLVRPRNPDLFLQQEMQLSTTSHSDVAYHTYAEALQAYRRGGEPAMWRSIIANGDRGRIGFDVLMGAHAALGEYEAAFSILGEAERKSLPLTSLPMDPRLLPLHRDPRFNRILGSQGFPPVS